MSREKQLDDFYFDACYLRNTGHLTDREIGPLRSCIDLHLAIRRLTRLVASIPTPEYRSGTATTEVKADGNRRPRLHP